MDSSQTTHDHTDVTGKQKCNYAQRTYYSEAPVSTIRFTGIQAFPRSTPTNASESLLWANFTE